MRPAPLAITIALTTATTAHAQSAVPAVFVLNNGSDNITAFTMNSGGALNFVENEPTRESPTAAAVSPDGRYLAVTQRTDNEVDDVVQIFMIAADATLTPVLTDAVPNAALGAGWLASGILAVTEAGDGASFLHTYRFNAGADAKPSLTLVDSEPTGEFTTTVVVHPTLPLVYTQDSFRGRIAWFTYSADGVLTPGGDVSTAPALPLRLAVTSDGSMLYVAGGVSNGRHAIVGLELDATGRATLHPRSPFFSPGDAPAYVAVSMHDQYLFVGHGADATVHSARIGPDGSLGRTGFSFDVGLRGTIGDVRVLGEFVLVTDESTATDGVSGLYSFRVMGDGSFTPVAPIYDVGGVRPESIVVWDPRIPGDLDADGDVDLEDLLILLSLWGHEFSVADLDGDGVVTFQDLLILLRNWG